MRFGAYEKSYVEGILCFPFSQAKCRARRKILNSEMFTPKNQIRRLCQCLENARLIKFVYVAYLSFYVLPYVGGNARLLKVMGSRHLTIMCVSHTRTELSVAFLGAFD